MKTTKRAIRITPQCEGPSKSVVYIDASYNPMISETTQLAGVHFSYVEWGTLTTGEEGEQVFAPDPVHRFTDGVPLEQEGA